MKLRDCFKKADNFLGEEGHSLIAGSTIPFAIIMLAADKPVVAGVLAALSLASACRADTHMQQRKKKENSPSP